MSFEMDQLSGDDSSSSSKFGSSDEEVHELLVVNSHVTGIEIPIPTEARFVRQ